MKKIKICHVLDKITGKADGVFAHLMMILNTFNRERYEHIVIFQGGEIVESELLKINIRFFTLKKLNDKFSFITIINIYKIIKKEKVDIIQSHLLKPYIYLGIINIITKIKHIFNYNGLFISSGYHNLFEIIVLKLIHKIIIKTNSVSIAIVPSKMSKKLLLSETNLFPCIEVYYNSSYLIKTHSIDKNIIDLLNKLKSKYIIIGIIARIERQKRIDLSLLLLKKLLDNGFNIFFVYMGDGPLEFEMNKMSQEMRIQNNCLFLGYVKNAQNYIKYFDIILFTSDWEGLPLTFWEAMYSSVPIISTDVGGAREILVNNNCGLVFPNGDLNEGEKAITQLIKNKALRNELGINGKKAITNKYNIDSFKLFFDNLYNDLHTQKL